MMEEEERLQSKDKEKMAEDIAGNVAEQRHENPIKRAIKARGMVTRSATGTMQKFVVMSPRKTKIDKGKALLKHSSSSSEESEDEEDSSATPNNVSVGIGSAPSGKPQQFTTDVVAAHYELLANENLNMEKGFDSKFMNANPFIKERVKVHGTAKDDEAEIAEALVVEGKSWEFHRRRKCWSPTVPEVGTGPSQIDPESASVPIQTANTLVMILAELQKMNSRLSAIEDRIRESQRSFEFVWSYMRDRDEVHRKYLASKEPLLAQELPLFPPGICPTASSFEDDPFITPTASTPTNGSEGL
ncbi:hypothetical protein L6452_32432 [Arctium lappa]|uniref:Uncharacterized protein n=1 Tax=Arctium lappa TaxID=4217 RepID=A0ACB8Z4A9_ARCLA|nr:hypothetical protein L6452_32432 [Arctium lappa]